MKGTKKSLPVAFTLLIVSLLCFQVMATALANATVLPCAVGKNSVSARIAIAQGSVSGCGVCDGTEGGGCRIAVSLQEQSNGRWRTVATARGTEDAAVAYNAKKGNSYQVKVAGYFYDSAGNLKETVYRTSPVKKY